MLVLPVLGVVASLVKRLAPERVRHPAAPKKAQTLFAARAGDGMHRQAQGRPRMFHAPSHAARGAGRPISASIQKRTAIAAANAKAETVAVVGALQVAHTLFFVQHGQLAPVCGFEVPHFARIGAGRVECARAAHAGFQRVQARFLRRLERFDAGGNLADGFG